MRPIDTDKLLKELRKIQKCRIARLEENPPSLYLQGKIDGEQSVFDVIEKLIRKERMINTAEMDEVKK